MAVYQRTVWAFRCERCDREWMPRKPWKEGDPLPTICPSCKTPYWNKPRRHAKEEEGGEQGEE